jgi:hypothetical protein
MEFDPHQAWYHGSPFQLIVLRQGSTITQKRDLARIFSHKPTVVQVDDDGQVKHNGTRPGFLYIITDVIAPDDVVPHPRTTMEPGDEWLTTRELALQLIGPTEIVANEQFTEAELAELLDRAASLTRKSST